MAKLTSLGSRIGTLPPRLAAAPKVADPFYQSAEWRAKRAKLARTRGRKCEEPGCETPYDRVILDHVVERKDGGADLDEGNLKWRCFAHHQRKTAKARGMRSRGQTYRGG